MIASGERFPLQPGIEPASEGGDTLGLLRGEIYLLAGVGLQVIEFVWGLSVEDRLPALVPK